MEIQEILKNLGLKPKEIEIYLAVLESGESTGSTIAARCRIKRPTAYAALNSLCAKGLVTKAISGGKTLFVAQHPRTLLDEAELRLQEVKQIVPQLASVFQKKPGKPAVMIYEGKQALDRAYDESFAVTGEVLYMSTVALSQKVFEKTFRKMDYAKLNENFRMRELVDDSPEGHAYARKAQGKYRKIAFIPKQFLPFEIDIGIFGTRTLITSLRKEYFTVGIESEEITQAFRSLFEAMWLLASPADA